MLFIFVLCLICPILFDFFITPGNTDYLFHRVSVYLETITFAQKNVWT